MRHSLLLTLKDWTSHRSQLRDHQSIGLVPTMGNLHQGHIEIIKKSVQENEHSIVTVFVNPKQFGPSEDFKTYPRTLEQDIEKIREHFSNDSVSIFAPTSTQEVFPTGFSTSITVEGELTNKLCGLFRPGHFQGVTTVVFKLFTLTRPHRAYFGEKDFQQFKIIEKMIHDLDLQIELRSVPIYREANGLALSSRNQYLSEQEVIKAQNLYQALREVSQAPFELEKIKRKFSKNLEWEYLEILDAQDLSEVSSSTGKAIVLGAAYVGKTRLIDNIKFELQRGHFDR